MLTNKKSLLLVISLVVFCSLVSLIILQTQAQKEVCYPEEKANQQENFRGDFPSVNYEYSPENTVDLNRKNKSKKYNKVDVLNPNINEDTIEVAFYDWEIDLESIPVDKSQVIVIGKINDSQAHLSESNSSVYSEFKIEVEKVLKDDVPLNLKDNKYLFAERQGGIVRYPSGFETWYFVAGQRMPKTGNKYVLFLTHDFPFLGYQNQDFYLITAYEIKAGKIFPLDNPSGGKHPLVTTYNGKDAATLLKDLQVAIDNLKNISPK